MSEHSWHGACEACGKSKALAYQPKSNPPKKVCLDCYLRWREGKA